jgi:hypothetical protein
MGAMILCSHGGMFKIMASSAPTVMVNGQPVLTVGDVAAGSMPGGTPCPFATPAGPAPCIKLASATGGMSTKVMAKGMPILLQTTMFLTIPAGAGAPVPAQVTFAGSTTVMAT